MKARLLASVCALGMLAAAPAFAGGSMHNDAAMNNGGMNNGSAMSGNSAADNGSAVTGHSTSANAGTTNAKRAGRGSMDTANSGAMGNGENGSANSRNGMAGKPANPDGRTGNVHAANTARPRNDHMASVHRMPSQMARSQDRPESAASRQTVQQLNAQSLHAARDGRSFQVGSAEQSGNYGSTASGQMGSSDHSTAYHGGAAQDQPRQPKQ